MVKNEYTSLNFYSNLQTQIFKMNINTQTQQTSIPKTNSNNITIGTWNLCLGL